MEAVLEDGKNRDPGNEVAIRTSKSYFLTSNRYKRDRSLKNCMNLKK